MTSVIAADRGQAPVLADLPDLDDDSWLDQPEKRGLLGKIADNPGKSVLGLVGLVVAAGVANNFAIDKNDRASIWAVHTQAKNLFWSNNVLATKVADWAKGLKKSE